MSESKSLALSHKSKVFFIRGQSVMIDKDLAQFYNTNLKVFNRARKRREELFEELTFQLTKEEYAEILKVQGLPLKKGHVPWVYTEKGAYKMAFILDTDKSLKVSDLILEIFLSVKQGDFLPSIKDNKIMQLEQRVATLEEQMKGKAVVNHFHSSVNLLQGDNNQIIHNDVELMVKIHELSHKSKDDSVIAPKMDELIELIREGKKEKISAYVKKTNDLMDVLSKSAPTWEILKKAISLVQNYFNF